jgi:short-subunit dehydrogenase
MKSSPVVIITGASSGIGEKLALTLGAEGYRLILAARRIDRLKNLVGQIRQSGGEALAVSLDLSEKDQIINLVNKAQGHYGGIDILVNNAGSAKHVWLDELSLDDDIQKQLQVNLVGMIQLTRLVLPGMLAAGEGQIIHVSSIAAWVGMPTYSIYTASKFGARGFLASLRRELRGTGVVVSEIFPGSVDTDFAVDPRVKWKTRSVTPAFVLATPQAVANRILQLIRRRRKKAVIPRIMWLAIWAEAYFPRFVSWILSLNFYTRDGIRYSWRQSSE